MEIRVLWLVLRQTYKNICHIARYCIISWIFVISSSLSIHWIILNFWILSRNFHGFYDWIDICNNSENVLGSENRSKQIFNSDIKWQFRKIVFVKSEDVVHPLFCYLTADDNTIHFGRKLLISPWMPGGYQVYFRWIGGLKRLNPGLQGQWNITY